MADSEQGRRRVGTNRCRAPARCSTLLIAVFAAVAQAAIGCDGCHRSGEAPGTTTMCGPCTRTADCQRGFACVNGTCETAPPSCHVKIGL